MNDAAAIAAAPQTPANTQLAALVKAYAAERVALAPPPTVAPGALHIDRGPGGTPELARALFPTPRPGRWKAR